MIIMIMMVYMIALKWVQYHKDRKQTAESTRNSTYENQPQHERYACLHDDDDNQILVFGQIIVTFHPHMI